jgi:hemolysin activation/secretion protein
MNRYPRLKKNKIARALWLGICCVAMECRSETAPGNPPESVEEPRFDIFEFQVDGNSVLPVRDIEKTVYPFLGPAKTLADVEKAQAALEKVYQDAGYPTVRVDIPEQKVEDRVVHLQVFEAKVERTRITGSRYFSLGQIRAGVPALAQGAVPHLPTVQKQLEELNKASGDRTVTPIARAGNTPGTTEWELKVDDKLPLHGSVEVNSRNTPGTTYTRLTASIRYDNLWQRFHSASFQFQTSPENSDEVQVYAGTYVMPWFDTGWRLATYIVGTNSANAVAVLGGSTILGNGQIVGLRAVRPLPDGGDYFHTLSVGLDYKNFGQDLFSPVRTDSTPVEYVPFTARYDLTLKHSPEALTTFGLEGNVLFRGMGNDEAQFDRKRLGSRTNYAYFGADLEHRHTLPFDTRLIGRLSGQIADGRLISNEQFTAGGIRSVRGYHEVEVLGDDGLSGSLEFYGPSLTPDSWDFADDLRAIVFADAARVWVIEPLNDQPDHYDLASAGVGTKWQFWKHLNGEVYWSYPFTRTQYVNPGNQRIDFRIAMEF